MTFNSQNNLKKITSYKKKQNFDVNAFRIILDLLVRGETIPEKYKDHPLKNNKYFKDCRELHINPDLILVYKY